MKSFIVFIFLATFTFTACGPRIVHHPSKEKIVVVNTPPRQYKVVVVNGKRYYRWYGNHYRKTRRGYVLVAL